MGSFGIAPRTTAPRSAARLGLALLLAAWPSLAGEPGDLRVDSELGYEDPLVGAPRHEFFGLSLTLPTASGLELSGGARMVFGAVDPNPGWSGYARASLSARHRAWTPALGLELEATTASARPPAEEPSGSFARAYGAEDREGGLRVALAISAARWQWRQLHLSFWTLRLITPLSGDVGQRVNVAFGVAGLGWRI